MVPRSDKREPILAAALELFDEKGFHGTSMPELARRAGVAAGTIYRYFDSKEQLVNVLFQEWKAQFNQELMTAVMSESSWRARFRAMWLAMARFQQEHPRVLSFLELHHHADYLDETSQALEAHSAAALFELIRGGQADEAFVEMEPAALIAQVYGGFLGLLRGAQTGWFELSPELVEASEERAWALIRR